MAQYPILADYQDALWVKKHLAKFRHTFLYLTEKACLKSSHVAAVFATTENYLNVLKLRARLTEAEDAVLSEPLPLGLRLEADPDILDDTQESDKYEQKSSRANAVYKAAIAENDYVSGANRLKALRKNLGHPHLIAVRRAIGELYLKRAHLLIDGGHCESGFESAQTAFQAFDGIHKERPSDSDAINGLIRAARSSAHACTLSRNPLEAMRQLDIAEALHSSSSATTMGEHHRLRGVALLQMVGTTSSTDHVREAASEFQLAARSMEDIASDAVELEYLSDRHMLLVRDLQSDIDIAQDVLEGTKKFYGIADLHTSVSTHWAAARWLRTKNVELVGRALKVIEENLPLAQKFDHQRTIACLLYLTPALNVPRESMLPWMRWAMYENAMRSK